MSTFGQKRSFATLTFVPMRGSVGKLTAARRFLPRNLPPVLLTPGLLSLPFKRRRRHVVQGRVKSIAVVKGQVVLQHRADFAVIVEAVSVEDLGFHRMEEGFDEGIVGDLARTVHALSEA